MQNIVNFGIYTVIVTVLAYTAMKSYRIRLIMVCYLLFLFFIHPNVYAPSFFGGHPRLPIALLLCISGWPELKKTLYMLNKYKMLVPVLLWFSYTAISAAVISTNSNYTLVYQQLGDILVLLLVATYVYSSSYKELLIILLTVTLALMINLAVYMPRVIPMLSYISTPDYYHHGGAGLSGFKAMPILLFLNNRKMNAINKIVIKLLIVLSCLMAFLSGSRTAMLGIALILLLYNRSIKWWITIVILGSIALYAADHFGDTSWGSERVERLYRAFEEGEPTSLREVEFRLEHFEIGLQAYRESPIVGYGFGSWDKIRGEAYSIIGSELAAHSAYALLVGETGTIGIILFLSMVVVIIKFHRYSSSKIYQEDLAYTFILGVITYMLLGFNSSSFWNRDFTIFLGMTAGSKLRIYRVRWHKLKETNEENENYG